MKDIKYYAELHQRKQYKEILSDLANFSLEDPYMLSVRGVAYKQLGLLDKALKDLEKATSIKNDPNLLCNLGNAYRSCGKIKDAVKCYKKSLELMPKNRNALDALGLAYFDIGELDLATQKFKESHQINPTDQKTIFYLAESFRKRGEFRVAISFYEQTVFHTSKSQLLDCLYRLREFDRLKEVLSSINYEHFKNALAGSVIEHYSVKSNIKIENPFCSDPLSMVQTAHVVESKYFSHTDVRNIIELLDTGRIDHKAQSLLNNGYQTAGNIFNIENESIKKAKALIVKAIDMYRGKSEFSENNFIKNWPINTNLYGWLVDIRSGGRLKKHIHKEGWLSGTLYLSTPEPTESNQGAISFSIEGDHFPSLGDSRGLSFSPRPLSLCLFPSSLFHETREYFDSSNRRVCIAFDVIKQS